MVIVWVWVKNEDAFSILKSHNNANNSIDVCVYF